MDGTLVAVSFRPRVDLSISGKVDTYKFCSKVGSRSDRSTATEIHSHSLHTASVW